jgi:hypothetical protein
MRNMKLQLSHIAGIALLIAATFAGVQRAQAQFTYTWQGVLDFPEFGPCPDDGYNCWVFQVVPFIPPPPNCAPEPCPPYILGTNTVTLGKGGYFTMPIVIPEEFLTNVSGLNLQFMIRTNGFGPFTTLSPAMPLTATPFATVAHSVSGPIPANSLIGSMPTGMLTGIFSSPLSILNPSNVFAGDGSRLVNVNATTIGGLGPCDLPCFWKTNGNAGTDPNFSFLGTTDAQPLTLKVHNQPVMRYFPHPIGLDGANLIGGAYVNTFSGGAGSVICGGGGVLDNEVFANVVGNDHSAIVGGVANVVNGREGFIGGGWGNTNVNLNSHCVVISGGASNQVTADFGTISGGVRNIVTGFGSVAAGGSDNSALGGHSTVSGGTSNQASGSSAVVAGGQGNQATGLQGAVGGGWFNTASGTNSTVPGGSNNVASGSVSLAAGSGSRALHDGTYVWSDSQAVNFVSSGNDQYLIRAAGGVGIGTATPVMQLHVQGDTRVTGVFRSGSETGTSEPSHPAGLVVRRINSTSAAVNQVVARNDHVTLERDGSNGGMIIRYPAGAYRQAIACTAMTSTGSLINYYTTLLNPGVASTFSIYSGATNVVQFHCTFGDSYNDGHHTEVNMVREGADFYWVGTLTSTYNQ